MFETQTALKEWQLPDDAADCLAGICAAIDAAALSIRVLAFNYTHPVIHAHLKAARRRGAHVRLIADRLQSASRKQRSFLLDFLHDGGAPDDVCICTSDRHEYMHEKALGLDCDLAVPDALFPTVEAAWGHYPVVFEGSLNFSLPAFAQENTVLCMPGKLIATDYMTRFESLFAWGKAHEPQYQLDAPSSVQPPGA